MTKLVDLKINLRARMNPEAATAITLSVFAVCGMVMFIAQQPGGMELLGKFAPRNRADHLGAGDPLGSIEDTRGASTRELSYLDSES